MKKLLKMTVGLSALALVLSGFTLANEEAHNQHATHPHRHGSKSCKHKAEKHGDHTDYEHDGHHHKKHEKHVDECKGPEAQAE